MTVRVGPKGQVVIPKVLRASIGIEPGDEVDVLPAEVGVLIVPVVERSLKGVLAGRRLVQELEAEHRREVAGDS